MLLGDSLASWGQARFAVLPHGYSRTQSHHPQGFYTNTQRKKRKKGRGGEEENFRDHQCHTPFYAYCGQSSVTQTSWQQGKLGRVGYLSALGEMKIGFGKPGVSCGEEMSQKKEGNFSRAQRAFQPEMNCIKSMYTEGQLPHCQPLRVSCQCRGLQKLNKYACLGCMKPWVWSPV